MKTELSYLVGLSALLLCSCAENQRSRTAVVLPSSDSRPGQPQPKEHFDRPTAFVPGRIPERVRYRYADDADVTRVGTALSEALKRGSEAKIFDKSVMVFPGAWRLFGKSGRLGRVNFTRMPGIIPGVGNLESVALRDPAELATLAAELRARLADDGGFTLRALSSEEMSFWWTFIPFDIEEPVYIAESKGKRYRFLLSTMLSGDLVVVDELNSLPKGG